MRIPPKEMHTLCNISPYVIASTDMDFQNSQKILRKKYIAHLGLKGM